MKPFISDQNSSFGSNVDRLFAMWQALYPDSWIAPTISPLGTYTQAPGTIVTGRTRKEEPHRCRGPVIDRLLGC